MKFLDAEDRVTEHGPNKVVLSLAMAMYVVLEVRGSLQRILTLDRGSITWTFITQNSNE